MATKTLTLSLFALCCVAIVYSYTEAPVPRPPIPGPKEGPQLPPGVNYPPMKTVYDVDQQPPDANKEDSATSESRFFRRYGYGWPGMWGYGYGWGNPFMYGYYRRPYMWY